MKTKKPDTSFELVCEWVEKARVNCEKQGRKDAAALWTDALEHLKYWHEQALHNAKGKR